MCNSVCDLRFRFAVGSIRLLSERAIPVYSGRRSSVGRASDL